MKRIIRLKVRIAEELTSMKKKKYPNQRHDNIGLFETFRNSSHSIIEIKITDKDYPSTRHAAKSLYETRRRYNYYDIGIRRRGDRLFLFKI